MYSVKEIFYSLQGEGAHSGRPAVFCRFTGCNLWSGLERDKSTSPCPFCDTDFVGVNGQNGNKYDVAELLAEKINSLWPKVKASKKIKPYVVFTGGEPLLQLDNELISEMHKLNFEVAVETNGTIKAPENVDWICVSPKDIKKLKIKKGNELKLLYPLKDLPPKLFESLDFDHFYIQAIDCEELNTNKINALNFCLKNPQWHYSIQLHKVLNID